MTERERWIIYPLLFFALGAALRDKFLEHVSTKELECTQLVAKHVVCEELSVLDSSNPDRIVAKLTSRAPEGLPEGENADRFGVLLLIDSQNKEFCGVTNNTLQVRQIDCDDLRAKAMSVIDPVDPQRRLALLTSATATMADRSTRRVGSLLLTDHEGAAIFGLANDQMQMRNIVCQGIAVTDPENPARLLAILGSAMVERQNSRAPARRLGVLQLNDQRFIGLSGDPTEAPVDSPPPPREPEERQEVEQQDEEPTESSDEGEANEDAAPQRPESDSDDDREGEAEASADSA